MITTEECEARIRQDAELMRQTLNDNDFAGWLVSSIGPRDSDALEYGERVRSFIDAAVTAFAEDMAKEINEQEEYEADAAHESRLIDRDNARAINAGRY